MEIKIDTPIEVNSKQYQMAMTHLDGVVAGREAGGKYFIKLWVCSYKKELEKLLNRFK